MRAFAVLGSIMKSVERRSNPNSQAKIEIRQVLVAHDIRLSSVTMLTWVSYLGLK